MRWRRAELRDKFESLVNKEREVHAFLDGFETSKQRLANEAAARCADVKELLASITKLEQLHVTASPTADKLQAVKDELEYKRAQKNNSAETTVRSNSVQTLSVLNYQIKAEAFFWILLLLVVVHYTQHLPVNANLVRIPLKALES